MTPPSSPGSGTSPSPHNEPGAEPRLLTRDAQLRQRSGEDHAGGHHRRHRKPRRPHRRRRFLANTLLTLAALGPILLLSVTLWMRHSMRAALPQIEGTLHISGLSSPVQVTRDEHGIPSITGSSIDDVVFAQGYITAQDRLWQMDTIRRHAAGELSELLGSRTLTVDRFQRTLQLRATADRAVTQLPPDQLHQLEVYARGINAFIDQNRDHLPLEFHLLLYTPAHWTPRDSLLVSLSMSQDFATEFPQKLGREVVAAHLPATLAADLYPVGNWRDHPPSQAIPDLTSPRPEIEQIPLDETQTQLEKPTITPRSIDSARAALLQPTCDGCIPGSNNWAVAGSHTASGAPLVSNDMHLALAAPDIWYRVALHTTDNSLDVTGVSLPGAPFVIVGRNPHVAWGFTVLGADTQEIYIEHLRGDGSSQQFQHADGTWSAVSHHTETIRVRGGSKVTLDVLTTQHTVGATTLETPVITPLFPGEHRTLSLAWTAYDLSNLTVPFLAVNQAPNGAALVVALSHFGSPSLNLVYGDDSNHIGYHAIGNIPIRGAAVHHPIAAPQPDQAPNPGEPPPATEEEEENPAASLTTQPHLLLAAFRPTRRSPKPAAKPTPKAAAKAEPPIPAPPAPPSYTIGSPISPIPVDALSPDAQWSGYIPFDELPLTVDPSSGIVATANSRITPDGYPYAITLNWISPYRVERILRLLANRNGLTPADMLHTQMDIHSEFNLALAHRIAYALDHSPRTRNNARLRAAADILRRWNGDIDATSAAPTILAATRGQLWPMLLVPQIAAHDHTSVKDTGDHSPKAIAHLYTWGEEGSVLEQLVTRQPSRWLPSGFATWNDFLAAAVDRALIESRAPSNLSSWTYGKHYPIEIGHPLFDSNAILRHLLGVPTGTGPRAASGDSSSIDALSHSFGPSERFTADLSAPDANTLVITTGQSGNPASPWYLDQFPHWLDGTTLPAPLHPATSAHTLILEP